MILRYIFFGVFVLLFACQSDEKVIEDSSVLDDKKEIKTNSDQKTKTDVQTSPDKGIKPERDTITEETLFSSQGFSDKKYYELLIETRLCNPDYDPKSNSNTTPCSAKFFEFFPYNHKRDIEDAFLLQVKAGVNNFPYRRLLIFVRENGRLVLMNGIIGYLVKRVSSPNEIDDLIVAVFDDLGNDKFDRYDVLLRYTDGKYHFVEAVGDLQGTFKTEKLKKAASKAILKRIKEKELIF
ncbi:hypothetical protein CW751_08685 [Brumimicrobium salinarum]|uniref:Lipoprotein n=1 Tax=Brumimicrobium salinarum TaxID=2058658 RepID=A0A2I0R2M0_9FLAO|nr:hypothetical protein [Brumimicrobium salinarum]PKR80833.1 hypothetical protein CW751_08685 [Brumimicrobium salinarum]